MSDLTSTPQTHCADCTPEVKCFRHYYGPVESEARGGAALPPLPDEWLLSISIMEAAWRIGLEMVVGHSWRELAMLTNAILSDQLAARLSATQEERER